MGNKLRTVGTVILLILITGMLMACKGTLTEVRVAVPVICTATEPTRPVMPTETLVCRNPLECLDEFVQAATAEIERREGYEGELVQALRSCIAPVQGKP